MTQPQQRLPLFDGSRVQPAMRGPAADRPAEIASEAHPRDQGRQPAVEQPADEHHQAAPIDTQAAARPSASEARSNRQRILEALIQAGTNGRTDHELAEQLQLLTDTVRPQRLLLRQHGLIHDSRQRRRTPTGKWATVWVVNETGLKLGYGSALNHLSVPSSSAAAHGPKPGDQAAGEPAPWEPDGQPEGLSAEQPEATARNLPAGRYDNVGADTPISPVAEVAGRIDLPEDEAPTAHQGQTSQAQPLPPMRCPRCGSTRWRDIPIHNRQSTKRVCAGCRLFLGFTRWYGRPTAKTFRRFPSKVRR